MLTRVGLGVDRVFFTQEKAKGSQDSKILASPEILIAILSFYLPMSSVF